MKVKTHELIIKLTFDRPCTAGFARRAAGDCINGGEFYPTSYHDEDPETFRVRSFKLAPRAKKASHHG